MNSRGGCNDLIGSVPATQKNRVEIEFLSVKQCRGKVCRDGTYFSSIGSESVYGFWRRRTNLELVW
jgi:hypothetical protein